MTIQLWTRKVSVVGSLTGGQVLRSHAALTLQSLLTSSPAHSSKCGISQFQSKPEAPGGAADTENRLLGLQNQCSPTRWVTCHLHVQSLVMHWQRLDRSVCVALTLTTSPPSTFISWRRFCCSRLVLERHFSRPSRSTGKKTKKCWRIETKKRKHFLPFSQFHLHSRGENIKRSFQQMTVGTTVGVFLCKLQI